MEEDERISGYLVYIPYQGNLKTLAGELKNLLKNINNQQDI